MEKLIIFDLDGVLVDSRDIHFHALNNSLARIDKKYIISVNDHQNFFDGLSTITKLKKLTELRNLPLSEYEKIWRFKQEETLKIFQKMTYDSDLIEKIKLIRKYSFKIGVASNSIRQTIEVALNKLGILEFIDVFFGNEDVNNQKPHPEIFWKCMSFFSTTPSNTVIFEDSKFGKTAAIESGAFLIPVENRYDLTIDKIEKSIAILTNTMKTPFKWTSSKLNVLIPMAGEGSRFSLAGYSFPKPLIDVRGKPMIQCVVENLNIEANFIFLVRKEHLEKYNVSYLLNLIAPNCKIVVVDKLTEGAASTTLLAKAEINNEQPLLIANSDQIIDWDSHDVLTAFNSNQIDGGILTFKSTHPMWSYVRLGQDGFVTEVAEKKPISNNATVGIYFWKKGSDYVKYAEQMINKNIRTNGEFYVCPVFNEAILDNKKIKIVEVKKMWGIGTPESLSLFLNSNEAI